MLMPHRRRVRLGLAAATAAAVVLVPGTALAQPLPIPPPDPGALAGEVEKNLSGLPGAPQQGDDSAGLPVVEAPLQAGPIGPPVVDDDSPGHETEDPVGPDHGSGFVGNVDLGEGDVADVAGYNATIQDDDTSSSDVTVLGLLGSELIGAHSNSEGTQAERVNLLGPLCEGTGGGLCLNLLYAEAISEDDGDSTARARGGVAAVCLFGSRPNALSSYDCNGPIVVGAAEGDALIGRHDETGHTGALSHNDLVRLCLGGQDALGDVCQGLGLSAVHSRSLSESVTPSTFRASYLLGFDFAGNRSTLLSNPAGLAIPPGCGGPGDANPALLCLFFNQGESFLFSNGAASVQEQLHLDLLRNTPIAILVELGRAETLVHQADRDGKKPPDGEKPPNGEKPPGDDGKDDDNGKDDDGVGNGKGGDGDLAFTGANVAGLAALAFGLLAAGAGTMAVTRRRVPKHLA